MPKELTDLNTDSTQVNVVLSTHLGFVHYRTRFNDDNEFTDHIFPLLERRAPTSACERRRRRHSTTNESAISDRRTLARLCAVFGEVSTRDGHLRRTVMMNSCLIVFPLA